MFGSFEIKIILTLAIILFFFRKERLLTKNVTFSVLFILYSFAYIFSPYWLAFAIRPPLEYIALGFFFVFGLMWANTAASALTLVRLTMHTRYLVLLAGIIYILNYFPLRADIAWRGDEEYHIKWLLDLFSYFRFVWDQRFIYHAEVFLLAILGILTLFLFATRTFVHRIFGSKFFIALIVLLVPIVAVLLFSERIFAAQKILMLSDILRYPTFSRWLQLIFILPDPYIDVRLLRIIPFLSHVFISWILFYFIQTHLKHKWLSLLYALSLSTLPLMVYYSSILYLEMPLIACMLLSFLNLEKIIAWEFGKLKSHYIWYVLLFAAFIKETVVVGMLLLIGLRFIYQLKNLRNNYFLFKNIPAELQFGFSLVSPMIIYVVCRYLFVKVHTPLFTFANAVHIASYVDLFKSHVQQTGLFFILSFVGFLLLWNVKQKFIFWTHAVLFLGFTFFFLGYYSPAFFAFGNEEVFIGYSRWNFIGLTVLMSAFIFSLRNFKRSYHIFIIAILIVSNIVYYPFHSDGVRFSNWGTLRADAAEYVYPYEAAIQSLQESGDTKQILWFGHYSPYLGLQYYFEKYSFWPTLLEKQISTKRIDAEEERRLFAEMMKEVRVEKMYQEVDTILYHSVNNIDRSFLDESLGQFTDTTKVKNSTHSLYIFKKQPSL